MLDSYNTIQDTYSSIYSRNKTTIVNKARLIFTFTGEQKYFMASFGEAGQYSTGMSFDHTEDLTNQMPVDGCVYCEKFEK